MLNSKGQFMKGHVPWSKGKKFSSSHKGRPLSEKHKAALRKPKSVSHPLSLEHRKKVGDSHRGSKSVNWKGGITPQSELVRSSMEYKLWRQAVFVRDNFTCQGCGDAKGGNLQAHHIKPFSTHPELHYAIDNGQTLCVICHQKTESYGGRQTYKNKMKSHV